MQLAEEADTGSACAVDVSVRSPTDPSGLLFVFGLSKLPDRLARQIARSGMGYCGPFGHRGLEDTYTLILVVPTQ